MQDAKLDEYTYFTNNIEKMIFKNDIVNRIEKDFDNKSQEVFKILEQAILATDYLNSDRIIRCIIFLADKNIDKLKKHIETAIFDPRDVMYWAEYTERTELDTAKRVRDFNKVFEESEINVNK